MANVHPFLSESGNGGPLEQWAIQPLSYSQLSHFELQEMGPWDIGERDRNLQDTLRLTKIAMENSHRLFTDCFHGYLRLPEATLCVLSDIHGAQSINGTHKESEYVEPFLMCLGHLGAMPGQ